MTLTRAWIGSPNYSSRGGSSARLIVLHTSEGSTTYQSLGSYFANSSSQVSSHVGIDNKVRGTIGEYVKRGNKAWTQGNANPVCVSAELCTPAGGANWSRDYWLNSQKTMLDNTADWIAEEAKALGIPITALTSSQAQGSSRGVCDHNALGSWGGGHYDCGNGFPMDYVISKAGGSTSGGGGSSGGGGTSAPPLHVDYFGQSHNSQCADVRTWQQQMKNRGWSLGVDGIYGPQSDSVCRQFQAEKGLGVDGKVGPQTWGVTWTAPVT